MGMSFVDGTLSDDGTFTPPGETPPAAPENPEGAPTPAPEATPAGDAAPPASPEGETPPAQAPTETPTDYAARVAEWGGEEAITDAIAIATALQDEEGVRALVEEGLKHLGYDPSKVFAPAPTGEPEEPKDPDRLLTAAEMEEALNARDQRAAQAQLQQASQVALEAVDTKRQALGIEDADEWDQVRTFAQRYAGPDELDPRVLTAAVEKGHADYLKSVEKAVEKYRAERKDLNDTVPTTPSGGGTGGTEEPVAEPKNMDEARKLARKFLGDKGE